jgi:2-amino-4-hydroxy-6-hydroxymethyldihydropteridine diphosphokinase
MRRGYISLGSNINQEQNTCAALRALENLYGTLITSNVYETEAVGFVGDPFYNLIIGFDSDQDVKAITKQLRQIEKDQGRTRDSRRYAARTLDLDLILYGDLIISDGRLQLPRDEIERYSFVLEPLVEIAPALIHPVSKKSIAEIWRNFDKANLNRKRVNLECSVIN